MRWLTSVAVLGLALSAMAQDRSMLESSAVQGLANLGASGDVHLRVSTLRQVAVRVGNQVQNVPLRMTELHFRRLNAALDPNPVIVAELVTWERNEMVRRIVADGATVYAYDLRGRSQMALPYARPEDARPEGQRSPRYMRSVMAYLGAVSRQEETEAMRLLRYILNPPADSTRLNWLLDGTFDRDRSSGGNLVYTAGPIENPRKSLRWTTASDPDLGERFAGLELWRADGSGFTAGLTSDEGASYLPATRDSVAGFRRLLPPRMYSPDGG